MNSSRKSIVKWTTIVALLSIGMYILVAVYLATIPYNSFWITRFYILPYLLMVWLSVFLVGVLFSQDWSYKGLRNKVKLVLLDAGAYMVVTLGLTVGMSAFYWNLPNLQFWRNNSLALPFVGLVWVICFFLWRQHKK
jgi:hypothetical protein